MDSAIQYVHNIRNRYEIRKS